MKDTYIKNKLKELESRIENLENKPLIVPSNKNSKIIDIKDIKTPQENYKQSVDEKERIAYNERPKPATIPKSTKDSSCVSTTVSGDGKSPVDNIKQTKSKEKKDGK